MKNDAEERKVNPVDATKVKAGDLMAFVYWVKVSKNDNGQELQVQDLDRGQGEFYIRGKDLIVAGASADQYQETEKITKTKAAEILIASHNRPLTVNFIKQDGKERTLRGRLIRPEPLLGRSMCEDLEEKDVKKRVKLVDHRTVQYLIVDGVKYEVK